MKVCISAIAGLFVSVCMSQVVSANDPELTLSVNFNDKRYHIGDWVESEVTVSNPCTIDMKDITLECLLPHQLVSADTPSLTGDKHELMIPSLSTGESRSITFSCRAIEAGRGRIYYKLSAGNFEVQQSYDISIAGTGWYGGDCHTHTNLSDGTGTVRQNVESSYAKGMSFLYTLDHNDTRSHIDSERITAESGGDFIAITGVEVDNLEGHGGCFQVPYNIPGGSYLFFTYPVYEGFFEVITKGATEPIRIPYRDTNLDASYAYFAAVFGDREYELVWVPGHGRPQDFTGWDLTGKIALISRGTNEFVEKIANAKKAGAVAAVIYDARTGVFNMPLSEGLYGVSITKADGERLTGLTESTGGTIGVIKFSAADLPPKPSQRGAKTWQDMIDETIAGGGFFMPVHPADPTYPFLNVYTIRNHVGLEVWNGANGINASNIRARKYWDELNARGEYKYVGLSNTDSHTAEGTAITFNMCKLDSLTIDNINNVLKTGATYGTNGPQLRFDIDGISMGETLKIKADKRNVRVNINAFDDLHPLVKIDLYRLKVTGETEDTKETVKSWDLTGQPVFIWSESFDMNVSPGEFYRMEIQSEKAAVGDVAGFACSNPVWIEKTNDAANHTGITNIKLNYSGAKLLQTKAGNYFIRCNDPKRLHAGQLKVTAVQGALVANTYDAFERVFQITVTSPDGANNRRLKIFVIN